MQRAKRVMQVVGGLAASVALVTTGASVVSADPAAAKIEKAVKVGPQRQDLTISSPAMGGEVQVTVLLPQDQSGSRGTLYLLDGAGDKTDVSDWVSKGHAPEFFADKDVNVVLPSGKGAFYTDWEKRDPVLGQPKWETFLTKELPPLIDEAFNGDGNNAVAGLSMGGQAAFALAARNPGLYTGAGSMSGCPPVTGIANESYVRATVARDGGDANNMWGPWGSPGWAAHDPSKRLDALRGKNLYLSAGTGIAGPLDEQTKGEDGLPPETVTALGGGLEVGAYRCSLEFALVLRARGVPATENFHTVGTHAWPYWAKDLGSMWPVLARGL
ncbi:alpha/beta hydrolase family protein [Williamsia sp.]|uniref:alpha/beta hydrolase n=1 Tax=Williamsia sp. TaxID=1872085 RepID=UPI002F94D716